MADTDKMLRAIINGQSAMKNELLTEINKVKNDLNSHREETKAGFEKMNKRMDKLGLQLAELEDDAPTREEFEEVETRALKVEASL